MRSLTKRIERDLRDVAGRATPSRDAWLQIQQRIERVGDDDAMEVAMIESEETRPTRGRRPVAVAAAAAVLIVLALVAAVAFEDRGGEEVRIAGQGDGDGAEDASSAPSASPDVDAPVVISVDNRRHLLVEPDQCFYDPSGPSTERPLVHVIGRTADGTRLELVLHHDADPIDPVDAPGYTGRLSVQSGGDVGSWRPPTSEVPWPTLAIEPAGMSGELTMTDRDGQAVEVTISVFCDA